MPSKLSLFELESALTGLEGWQLSDEGNALVKSFAFKNFSEAWGAMSQIALIAEKMDHHPNWTNVYNHLDITLFTHTEQGVTELDVKLAGEINKIVGAH